MTPKLVKKLTRRAHNLAKKFAKENGMRDDLVGCCAIASTSLYLALKTYGLDVKLVYGRTSQTEEHQWHHVWVEFDGKVLDATYKQFDKENECYIGQPTKVHAVFTDITYVENMRTFSSWSEEQAPLKSRLDKFVPILLEIEDVYN